MHRYVQPARLQVETQVLADGVAQLGLGVLVKGAAEAGPVWGCAILLDVGNQGNQALPDLQTWGQGPFCQVMPLVLIVVLPCC